ncbi:sigma-54 dependent transcriptional regulator [Parvibaculum sp.]|jgi:DNA-binding NtrC family response regulator|uniref:sigma-54-dependent transcriptional regulator FlbD n=1 Tax=Parvibaculum sp. TaxID=2024848 RepID=UPI000C512760|nr:sigma-54 dependent transcriptional regulator [Parvibaculum sp.]MAU59698.1 sigma-54-dependent Fis family transcriptional regulator [Parvibaculum sp.]MBO6667778.1 sigma-54-dependent Fis family transcriptional regulator [Parvibaculum sp.]MBO6690641.1 sigma-54-dependent Fis family transcriptional regulator [Parvibaculum sp.]MBO6714986.1 sigma-54-dependent Fis family transcriptional regulator [Parvibaculum sp.]|tara:strand:- start:7940 stop:9307 length:1368 start_codon:yes stop_codon:yes gene_type:complete
MRLLIVGTLNGQLSTATKMAMAKGAKVTHTETVDQAIDTLRSGRGADLMMVDVAMDIAGLIPRLQAEHICLPVVACGVETDARAAVNAIRAGAKEYIPLPPDADLIAAVLAAVAEENHALIFQDPKMGSIVKLADQVAPSEASILITGESGTGKEVIAHYVHSRSLRRDKPFISVNCAAIPENLLESELFGHEKGAFTGAVARRIGKFEEADGGTLLLDEISEMDIRLQAKLLRAIQERVIDRVGGKTPVKVNIRIIATSNRDLQAEARAGRFREDLFYRLNVVNLQLPPLRERPADILALAEHFAARYAKQNGLSQKAISAEARRFLGQHRWSGNVRELENTMHRAVLLSTGTEIDVDAIRLPDGSRLDDTPLNGVAQKAAAAADAASRAFVGKTVAEVEQDLILQTLDHCLGNRTHAANILGISIRTLRNKLKEYGEQGVQIPTPGEARPQFG